MESIHRYLLSSERRHKYNVINSITLATGVGRCIVAETKSRCAKKRVKRRQGQKLHFSDRDERSIFFFFEFEREENDD